MRLVQGRSDSKSWTVPIPHNDPILHCCRVAKPMSGTLSGNYIVWEGRIQLWRPLPVPSPAQPLSPPTSTLTTALGELTPASYETFHWKAPHLALGLHTSSKGLSLILGHIGSGPKPDQTTYSGYWQGGGWTQYIGKMQGPLDFSSFLPAGNFIEF